MDSFYIQNLRGAILEDVHVTVHSSMLVSSIPSVRRRTSSEDRSTIDVAAANSSENRNDFIDSDDDESSVESSDDNANKRWFVCPCFTSKYTKMTAYNRINESKEGNHIENEDYSVGKVSKMDDSISSIDPFEDPVKPKAGIDSSSSVSVTVVEEESWSTESYSSEEADVCEVDENDYRRQVRFSSVEVRHYSIVIGDHFSCKQYPMTLDWSHSEPETISVDDHENDQISRKTERRSMYANFANWLTISTSSNGGNPSRESYVEQFRLADSKSRFERILEVTGLSRDELCDLETVRLANFFENRRRANIGLPLL
jgi:hypothetical protein